MFRKENYTDWWKPIKGKIAVVIMTFKGDGGCLQQCLRGLEVQKQRGRDIEVYILDDSNNPLEV